MNHLLCRIVDTWTDKTTGESIITATIITTEPNELIEEIHDRMPVILPKDKISIWLEQGDTNIPELLSFLNHIHQKKWKPLSEHIHYKTNLVLKYLAFSLQILYFSSIIY